MHASKLINKKAVPSLAIETLIDSAEVVLIPYSCSEDVNESSPGKSTVYVPTLRRDTSASVAFIARPNTM
jgi:hypothetical protein